MSGPDDRAAQRPVGRDLRVLVPLAGFVRPYLRTLLLGALALLLGAGAILAFGFVLRLLVDAGLSEQDPAALNRALLALLGAVAVMAAGAGLRIYLVTWLGERVVADLRRAVFANVIAMDPSFFERTRTGEVISRLTADTTLIQVVVGSTLAIAARNLLLIVGGLILMFLTSPMLTAWLLLGLPVVALPVWSLGRRYAVSRARPRTGSQPWAGVWTKVCTPSRPCSRTCRRGPSAPVMPVPWRRPSVRPSAVPR
jgi:ATP-binding cassette, subfamily B, bacterial